MTIDARKTRIRAAIRAARFFRIHGARRFSLRCLTDAGILRKGLA